MKKDRFGNLTINTKQNISAYLFMLPALFFFFVFVVVPIVMGLITSFFDYTSKNFEFSGLTNYLNLFKDEYFIKSVKNTLFLVIVSVPIIVLLSLFISVVLYQRSAITRSIFRGIYYLPVVTGTVAVVVVWKWLFDPYYGVLNYVLQKLGIINEGIVWLGNEKFAIWAIIIILITTSVGQPIILYRSQSYIP